MLLMKIQDSVQYLKGVGPKKKAALARLGIARVYDLLTYFPRTYEDQSVLTRIADLQPGTVATVAGTIVNLQEQTGRRGLTILTAYLNDGTGILQVTWFNQKYLKKTLKAGRRVFVSGKAAYAYGGRGQFAMSQLRSFQVLEPGEQAAGLCGILPVYAATEHLNQKFFCTLIAEALEAVGDLPELIPARILAAHHLMGRREALYAAHFPKDGAELKRARYRLAFSELYLIQCGLLLLKKQSQETKRGIRHQPSGKLVKAVLAGLPFTLTHDQQQAWQEICRDMERTVPMHRLVQGDVGSGKTVIAMLALVKTVENGRQGAMMAPTEILAAQHYENLSSKLAPLGIRVGYLSGHLTPKKRRAMHEAIARHEVDIVIGTHALIQDDVHFAHLGLVITDEQHRFGIAQRAALEKKGAHVPDVLVMTATPIPRTMTLTVYGDLDVSVIDELPPGRRPIKTVHYTDAARLRLFGFMKQEIAKGRQVYVVYPLIKESEAMDYKDLTDGYEAISRDFPLPEYVTTICHGKMKPADKEESMRQFKSGEADIMVATSVIEVGVDVPNATVMVIESAERFGLSQLHQLRGRVGRGGEQSYCILMSGEKLSKESRARLDAMCETNDGFRLAELDLKLRGAGDINGTLQSGMAFDLKIANPTLDVQILTVSREAAAGILSGDRGLSLPEHRGLRELRRRYSGREEIDFSMIS